MCNCWYGLSALVTCPLKPLDHLNLTSCHCNYYEAICKQKSVCIIKIRMHSLQSLYFLQMGIEIIDFPKLTYFCIHMILCNVNIQHHLFIDPALILMGFFISYFNGQFPTTKPKNSSKFVWWILNTKSICFLLIGSHFTIKLLKHHLPFKN